MKQNALLKVATNILLASLFTVSLSPFFPAITLGMDTNPYAILSELVEDEEQNYVVKVRFRSFFDKRKKSAYNKSGFNENSRRDSIFMFLTTVDEFDPINWWYNNPVKPAMLVVQFKNLPEASAFNSEIQQEEFAYIVKKAKVEEYKPRRKRKKKRVKRAIKG